MGVSVRYGRSGAAVLTDYAVWSNMAEGRIKWGYGITNGNSYVFYEPIS